MAYIKPFKALHYNSKLLSQIENLVCPAYDIIQNNEVKIYTQKHENNIIKLEKPIGLNCYENTANILKSWQNNSILTQDTTNSIYIYQEQFKINGTKKVITGIICLVKLENFRNKVVFPHEKTHSNAKIDRFELIKAANCNFSPIFSLYNDENSKITNIINKVSSKEPFINFTDDNNISHNLWKISDDNLISKICDNFKNKKLYIADGHHRYETALNYKNYLHSHKSSKHLQNNAGFVMMYLVDINTKDLTILPTHRMIKNISNFNPYDIIQKCKENFFVKKAPIKNIEQNLKLAHSNNIHSIGLYFGGNNYFQLENNKLSSETLDVDILQDFILSPIFNLDANNSSIQNKIDYTINLKKAISSVNSSKFQCAFLLNPTSIEQIMNKAMNFEKMPQKSTYFYPKPITGLVINKF